MKFITAPTKCLIYLQKQPPYCVDLHSGLASGWGNNMRCPGCLLEMEEIEEGDKLIITLDGKEQSPKEEIPGI